MLNAPDSLQSPSNGDKSPDEGSRRSSSRTAYLLVDVADDAQNNAHQDDIDAEVSCRPHLDYEQERNKRCQQQGNLPCECSLGIER